jgi:hypothetical protein
MDALKGLISPEDKKDPTLWDEINEQFSLTIRQVRIRLTLTFSSQFSSLYP